MDVERRSLLKGLTAGLAGSVIAPAQAQADAPSGNTDQAPPAAGSRAGLLDEHQRRTLSSLADLMLPGAVAAGAVDLIDRVAAVETAVAQRRLLNAIARFDLEARAASGSRWLDLAEAARIQLLTRASTSEPGQPETPAWTRGQPIAPPAEGSPRAATLRDDFDYLKRTIGSAYAATEAGMRDLGWSGRTSWTGLPGCDHPESAHD